MNESCLHCLIEKLVEISDSLMSAVSAPETIDKELAVLDANNELLVVIETLTNHAKTLKEES